MSMLVRLSNHGGATVAGVTYEPGELCRLPNSLAVGMVRSARAHWPDDRDMLKSIEARKARKRAGAVTALIAKRRAEAVEEKLAAAAAKEAAIIEKLADEQMAADAEESNPKPKLAAATA